MSRVESLHTDHVRSTVLGVSLSLPIANASKYRPQTLLATLASLQVATDADVEAMTVNDLTLDRW